MTAQMRSRDAEIRALFAALDRDKNGYVDKNELRLTMKDVGLELSELDLDLMMRAAVLNDRLFYEDFIRLMSGSVGRLHRKVVKLKLEEKLKRKASLLANNNGEDDELDNSDTQAMRVAFALFDRNGDGILTEDEIKATLSSLDVSFSSQNIRTIIDKVNQNGNGKLDFGDFRAFMSEYYSRCSESSPCPQKREGNVVPSPLTTTPRSPKVPSDPLACQENANVCDSLKEEDLISAAFTVFDKDRDGYLNATDLRSTMKQMGLILTEEDVRAMMRSVGVGPLGKISYSDFYRIYKSKTALDAEKDSLRRRKNRCKLPKRLETELKGVFEIFDLDGDGFITITEMADVLRSMGTNPSIDSIQDVFQQVDLDGNGKIDFREFLLLAMKYERPLPEDRETREMFNALDRDRNGFIDRNDLKSSFAGLGIPLTNCDVQVMMEEVGAADSDRISFNDFAQILQRNFAPRLRLLKSIKALHIGDFVPGSEAMETGLSNSDQRTSNVSMDTNQELPPAAISSGSTDNKANCAKTHVPIEIHVTMVTDDDADADAQKSSVAAGLTRARNPPLTDESDGPVSINSSYRHRRRRSSRWDSIFTPSSVATFCKTHDSYNTTPTTWIAFKVFDRNADGYISKAELQQTMSELGVKLTNEELNGMMNEADTNKDGKIDYTEFSKLMKGSFEKYFEEVARLHEANMPNDVDRSSNNYPERRTKGHEEEEIRAAFMVFDMDCNGLIDATELRMTMLHLGKKFNQPQVEAMIKAVDRNRDGKIDYEEFLEMMRSV